MYIGKLQVLTKISEDVEMTDIYIIINWTTIDSVS